jgi:hypothetical protein
MRKRSVRKDVAYQVIMEDLIEIGVVNTDAYLKLLGVKQKGELRASDAPVPTPIVTPAPDFNYHMGDGGDDE